MLTVPWQILTLSRSFAMGRLELFLFVSMLCGLACFLVSPGMSKAISRGQGISGTQGIAATAVKVMNVPRVRPTTAGIISSALVLSRRMLTRSKLPAALILSGFCIGLVLPESRWALAAAFIVPLVVANAGRLTSDSGVRYFERTTAAFHRPAPLLFTAFVLTAVTALPAIPSVVQSAPFKSAHVLLAMLAASFWLTWTCAGTGRRLLGISVYALVWYLSCFSDIPPEMDLLGTHGTAVTSFIAALGAAIALGSLLIRMDSHGYRSPQRAF
jgi:hypothetical protein